MLTLPGGAALRPRTLRLPASLPRLLACGLAGVIVAAGFWAHGVRAQDRALAARVAALTAQKEALAGQAAELTHQKAALAGQAAEASYLRDTVAALQGQATQVTRLRSKVATLLGKTSPPSAAPPQVVDKMDSARAVLTELDQTLPDFDRSLDELGGDLDGWRASALATPSIWPVRGPITSPFGPRPDPFGPGAEFHHGLDIAVPTGTPVHAAASGVVVFAGWDTIYGNEVKINHGNGIVTLYGHNSKLLVHVGERVVKGQVISESGSTGDSTGPHVHYEVIVGGNAVNPERYLPGGAGDLQASNGTGRGGYGGG